PHREDQGAGAVLVVTDPDAMDAAILRQLDLRDLVGDEAFLAAEANSLVAELLHHLGSHEAVGEARIVLDVGGLLEESAPGEALDDDAERHWDARGMEGSPEDAYVPGPVQDAARHGERAGVAVAQAVPGGPHAGRDRSGDRRHPPRDPTAPAAAALHAREPPL